MTTPKVDLKKDLDEYRAVRGVFRMVDIPERTYLAVDGGGDPNTATAFTEAVESMYPVAYALKFASKKEQGRDYVVMPLEGIWWAEDMDSFTSARDKTRWSWTLLMRVPDWIDAAAFERAVVAAQSKAPLPRAADLRLESLTEGLCVQTLHIGSFDDEAPVLARMHDAFIPENRLRPTGRHHEVYLSDARRVAPEKRRTILRQPVEASPAGSSIR